MSASNSTPNSKRLRPYFTLSSGSEQKIDQCSTFVSLPRGAPAISKGDSIAGAYVVVKGRLRVFCYTTRGTEATLYSIDPGETCVFAINSLFNNLRYPAWVEADLETELVVISGNIYKSLFREEPAIQDLTVSALSTVVYRLMHEMEQLQEWTLKQRLVNFLLNTATHDGVVSLTQQQIANHLGTTREVIARLLGELSGEALLSTGRGKIKLENTRELSQLLIA